MRFMFLSLLLVCSQAFGQYYPWGYQTWKAPVDSEAALPVSGNTPGDARIELTDFTGWVWNGSAWVQFSGGSGSGTVTSVSVVSTNGFAGTVANSTTTPAITLETSITGILNGNGTAVSALTEPTASVLGNTTGVTAGPSPVPLGTVTEATSSVLTLSSWTDATIGSPTIQVKQATTSQSGYLSSTDWNTFNGKQASGNYITALTGDVTASGPGSVAATLAATSNGTLTTLSGLTTASSLATIGTIGSGTWHGTAVGSQYGGTGINTSSSTGVPSVSSGTWSVASALVASLGGTGLNTSSSTGYPSINSGTWGVASASSTFSTLFETVATTLGDIIIGGASGAPTRLGIGTSSQVVGYSGGIPAWTTLQGNSTVLKAPTGQTFLSTGSTTGYLFTISTSSTCAVGDTYTNNSHTFTVLGALSAQSGQVLFTSGASAPTSTGTLTRSSGSGTSSITFTAEVALATYTLPTNPSPISLKIKFIAGGGGGGGSGENGSVGGSGGSGTSTVFGPNLLFANGGGGGPAGTGGNGVGGSASLGTGPIGLPVTGGYGGAGAGENVTNTSVPGGMGASTHFGGAGGAGSSGNGVAAISNTGAGGGGAGYGFSSLGFSGGGGGGGGFGEAIIPSPSSTYPYAIGIGGAAGTAGTDGNSGGIGGSGVLVIEEDYQ
jgi:hypothetical protein